MSLYLSYLGAKNFKKGKQNLIERDAWGKFILRMQIRISYISSFIIYICICVCVLCKLKIPFDILKVGGLYVETRFLK